MNSQEQNLWVSSTTPIIPRVRPRIWRKRCLVRTDPFIPAALLFARVLTVWVMFGESVLFSMMFWAIGGDCACRIAPCGRPSTIRR